MRTLEIAELHVPTGGNAASACLTQAQITTIANETSAVMQMLGLGAGAALATVLTDGFSPAIQAATGASVSQYFGDMEQQAGLEMGNEAGATNNDIVNMSNYLGDLIGGAEMGAGDWVYNTVSSQQACSFYDMNSDEPGGPGY